MTRYDILEPIAEHDIHQLIPTQSGRVEFLPIRRDSVEVCVLWLLLRAVRHLTRRRWLRAAAVRGEMRDLAVLG